MEEEIINLENGIDLNAKYNNTREPVILFLHFGSGNRHIWNGVLPYFENSFRIIVPDLRGHGKSSKPKKGYHIEEMAEDITLLLEELDVKRYYIVGSSLGAEIGTFLAAENPNRVKAIICEGALYNEFGKYGLLDGNEEEIKEKIEKKISEIDKRKGEYYKSEEEYLETQKRFFQRAGLWNKYFEEYIENNVCKDEEGRYTSCYPIYVSKQYMKNYYHFEFDKYYKNINSPVLFLPSKSEWDNENIQEIVKAFGEMAGNYEIKVLKGFPHAYGWMKMPREAAKVVMTFINKH
ncbi:MAG: alpha/beta hydrolase [Halanaerobiales bacterium]